MAEVGPAQLGPDGRSQYPAKTRRQIDELNGAYEGCLLANGAILQPFETSGTMWVDPTGKAYAACEAHAKRSNAWAEDDLQRAGTAAMVLAERAFAACLEATGHPSPVHGERRLTPA